MQRTFGDPAIRYAIKGAAEKRRAQEAVDKAVAERMARGGRTPLPKPGSLSNDLPERSDPPHADWQHWYGDGA